MPAKLPFIASAAVSQLTTLGQQIRAHRKALRVSATTAAQAAGMSRVTLHRIEKGEPTVTMGAYLNAATALGLQVGLIAPAGSKSASIQPPQMPAKVHLTDYPQLKQLAWHVQGVQTLTPLEAWKIYEGNWRHIDESALTPHERQLIEALREGVRVRI